MGDARHELAQGRELFRLDELPLRLLQRLMRRPLRPDGLLQKLVFFEQKLLSAAFSR